MKHINDILDFAIRREEEAVSFYTGIADKIKRPEMKRVFLDFSEEEKGHRQKLMDVRDGKKPLISIGRTQVPDLGIADYITDEQVAHDMDYRSALILAMKREKESFKLYTALANLSDIPEMKQLFSALAQEEAKHKLRIEIEYDEQFLTEKGY